MRWILDLTYFLVAMITLPVWLPAMVRSGKIRTDWRGRFGWTGPEVRRPVTPSQGADPDSPRLLIHAVSVGEVNAIRPLVDSLIDHEPHLRLIIAATTDTGMQRARDLFQHRAECVVVRFPFDFSFAVARFLRAVRPDVVALTELEVWPNFTAACSRRNIPLAVINGRLSARSFRWYRRVAPFVRPGFRRLHRVAVQDETYAARFRELGVSQNRLLVNGTMKWDAACIADDVPGAAQLADEMGIDRDKPLVVAGSTAPGEHELLHDAVGKKSQLLCAPRKPEWFDQAAVALPQCARRSRGDQGSPTGRFLLDTIGELRKAYALADVVVVGRTFGSLHGSDMMEPVALGKAVIVGPQVEDFQQTAEALRAGDGIVQCDPNSLAETIRALLANPRRRRELGENGRRVIRAHQGATASNTAMLLEMLAESGKLEPAMEPGVR